MNMPFYVAPEQVMKDRADYARKGIARGRSLIAVVYEEGVLICAENTSSTLHKVSEIYDRIAFAGVGRYNEFDQLRIAGIRHADMKGYAYSRADVDARSLANQYAQILGQVFTHEMKPMEVEILVAEIPSPTSEVSVASACQLFHILYDGTVIDESRSVVLGGETESIRTRLDAELPETDVPTLSAALTSCVNALSGPDRSMAPEDLEVAVLSATNGRRAFKRLEGAELNGLLGIS